MKVEKDLDKAAGQSFPRSVMTTGPEFCRILIKMCREEKVAVYEYFMATDLVKKDGRVSVWWDWTYPPVNLLKLVRRL